MKQVTTYKVFVYNCLTKKWRLVESHSDLAAAQNLLRRCTSAPNLSGNIIEDVIEHKHS
jgi:hypothetical protein